MSNLNQLLAKRLKAKHQKLSSRFLKGIEEGNFQTLTTRKKYSVVERLKKVERQLKELGAKANIKTGLSFKHWAVALALGIVVTSTSLAQKNEPNKKWANRVNKNNGAGAKTEAQNIFFTQVQQLGEGASAGAFIGDFDNDGDDDAIYLTYTEAPVMLINNGDFTFNQQIIPITNFDALRLADLSDFDGDGDLDLLTVRGQNGYPLSTNILRNDGNGNFIEELGSIGNDLLDSDKVLFADFDGDGDTDYAYNDQSVSPFSVSIYLNNTFNFTQYSTSTGFGGYGVFQIYGVADMDGDSDLDIVYRGQDPGFNNGIRILTNDGSGNFTDNSGFFYLFGYDEIAIGNLDNDGDVDILLSANLYPDVQLTPLLQTSPGVFTAGTLFTATNGNRADDLIIRDLNNDNNPEVIMSSENRETFIFENSGSAIFINPQVLSGSVLPANLDGNGDIDLFVSNGNIESYENTGGLTFSLNPTNIVTVANSYDIDLVDIDSDGDLDIIQGAIPRVWLNDGSGQNFVLSQEATSYSNEKHVFGRLDGDADLDFVAIPDNGNIIYPGFDIWTTNAGTLSFNSNRGYGVYETIDIGLADLDGDTDLDIALIAREGSTQFYLRTLINNGGLSFSQQTNLSIPLTSDGGKFEIGNIDADADLEIVLAYGYTVEKFDNDGAGNFTSSGIVYNGSPSLDASVIILADLDNDSDLDLFIGNSEEYAGNQYTLFNDGTGAFFAHPGGYLGFDSGGYIYQASVADVDNDGDLDIATANYGQGIQFFLNDGTGVFVRDDLSLGKGDEYTTLAFGDLDGDSDLDLVTGGYYIANKVFKNLGNVLEADSTALVAFYDATNGDNWTNTQEGTNPWKVGNVDTWFGVSAAADGVTALTLPNNNIEGPIPAEFNQLGRLTDVDLSGNLINDIQSNLSGLTALTSIDLSNNKLDFGDFELIGSLPGLVIGEQEANDVASFDLIPAGSATSVTFSIAGSANEYQWFRNGAIANGETTNTVDIASIDRSNMGDYYCEATNPDVPGLTITSATKTVLATAVCTGQININETDPATDGDVLLMRINSNGFDTTQVVIMNSTGQFQMNDVVLADYILASVVDTIAHPDAIPTYFGNTVFWAEADTLFINGDLTADVTAVFSANPTGDVGQFAGYLEEEIPDGGRIEARGRVSGAGVTLRRGRSTSKGEGAGELAYYVYTNDAGEFMVRGVEPGEYNIDIQYPGYPMDENSFIDITIGTGPKDSQVSIEALVDQGVISVRQLVILATEEFNNGILFYPNPTSDYLKVLDNENRGKLKVEVFTASGRKLKHLNFTDEVSIDVRELPAGQYIVTVRDDNGNELETRRILIE
ncbi:FG-GAP-like repeat-containing protein [Fulvivirga lutea]|uniref:VCBS repeat-containing protein n=1 Tax=Fulvivirga lutea TaxID=2810512 RepID=A0A975A0Z4_9BACT|nr:FG-GAP-like repeat-containing protein [Fulvivirga lutea]QSE97720.1 VCBS repeat-containing protein [Fulvivirga lutea]